MSNPIKNLTTKEWGLWLSSLTVVILSNLWSGEIDLLTLIAVCVGATALVFAAKGNVWAQFLMIVFCILYGVISWRFRYWGEMITYLGMSLPMAIWSSVTWLRNPSENGSEVAIRKLTKKQGAAVVAIAAVTTFVFWFVLRGLSTPNLLISTISVATSFLAASLTMLRSSYYALGYAANDIVLIILWTLVSLKDPGYWPVTVNFVIFLINDLYGFASWKKRECGVSAE